MCKQWDMLGINNTLHS